MIEPYGLSWIIYDYPGNPLKLLGNNVGNVMARGRSLDGSHGTGTSRSVSPEVQWVQPAAGESSRARKIYGLIYPLVLEVITNHSSEID